jgi:hypothetical protein
MENEEKATRLIELVKKVLSEKSGFGNIGDPFVSIPIL